MSSLSIGCAFYPKGEGVEKESFDDWLRVGGVGEGLGVGLGVPNNYEYVSQLCVVLG